MPLRRILVGAALAALVLWLAFRPPPQDARDTGLVERSLPALGTWVSFSAYAQDPAMQSRASAAFDAAAAELAAFEHRWRAFGEGELAQLNAQLAAGQVVRIPQTMLPLFRRALAISQASGGRFDPRLGRLVQVWGFDDEAHYRESPPPQSAIDAALASLATAPQALRPCPGDPDGAARCYGPAPGVAWDFGAIAKGWIVDRLGERFVAAGLEHFLINAGGNVLAHGRRGDRAWRIAIRHPRPQGQRLLAIVEPAGESVVTSGDYERFFEFEGRRYHHILDPRSGWPAQGLQAVSVLAADGALADAGSTALFVAGPEHWRDAARALGLEQVLAVRADGTLQATPAMNERMTLPHAEPVETLP